MEMMMKKNISAMMGFLFVASYVPSLMAFPFPPSTTPNTVPAFLWSSHQLSNSRLDQLVNYQTISSRDLARFVLSEGGWSNLLCAEKKAQQPVDLAIVFIGRELLSSDLSTGKHPDSALVDLLKVLYRRSNTSMAFPYVAAAEETMGNLLVSGFAESCGQDFRFNNVALSESCFVEGENFQKLADMHAFHKHLVSKMEKSENGLANLVIFCHGTHSAEELEQPQTESEVLSELISSVEGLEAKYELLYVSDPFWSAPYPSHKILERFLAEGNVGNESPDSTICDEVCKIKSSLLEGVFVGIVLLIILISGLCCMMGIDTPTRFEAPQDS